MGYILTPKRIRTGDLFEPQDYLPPKELIPLNEEAKDHVVNFVECIRTRSKPITHVEIGFQSTLPNLLALISMRKGRTVRWNGRAAELTKVSRIGHLLLETPVLGCLCGNPLPVSQQSNKGKSRAFT
jgi:hypothetical protein